MCSLFLNDRRLFETISAKVVQRLRARQVDIDRIAIAVDLTDIRHVPVYETRVPFASLVRYDDFLLTERAVDDSGVSLAQLRRAIEGRIIWTVHMTSYQTRVTMILTIFGQDKRVPTVVLQSEGSRFIEDALYGIGFTPSQPFFFSFFPFFFFYIRLLQ